MSRRLTLRLNVAFLAAIVALTGCSPTIRWPNLYHPGTAQQQRAEALRHDPYPLDDVGPEIVGSRPLAYQRPVREVERARDFTSSLIRVGPAPVQYAPPVQSAPVPYVPAPIVQPAPTYYPPNPATPHAVSPPPFRY